jgi:hypothetical protein
MPSAPAKAEGNWLTRMWSPASKAPEKKPDPAPDRETPDKLSPPTRTPNPMEEAAALRSREEKKYLERMMVCDKLREIADLTNDVALKRRANELEARAEKVYAQRTAHCPASGAVFESDQKTLDKHLGTGAPVAAAPSGSALFTVSGKEGRSTVLEEKR